MNIKVFFLFSLIFFPALFFEFFEQKIILSASNMDFVIRNLIQIFLNSFLVIILDIAKLN